MVSGELEVDMGRKGISYDPTAIVYALNMKMSFFLAKLKSFNY